MLKKYFRDSFVLAVMEDMHLQYSEVQSLEETSECMKFIVILQRISVLLHLDHLDIVKLEPSCIHPD